MVREILYYLIFIMLLLAVVNSQQDTNSFLQNNNLINVLTGPSLTNIVSCRHVQLNTVLKLLTTSIYSQFC